MIRIIHHLKTIHPLVYLSLLFALINTLLYYRYGVKYVNDSSRYISYADGLSNGFYVDAHNIWYLGYVLFVYFVRLFTDNLEWLIITQYFLGWVGMIAIYNVSVHLFSNKAAAGLSTFAYILFIEVHTWNSYILAESFYVSMLCITFYYLTRIYSGDLKWSTLLLTILCGILAVLAKPTGIALVAALGALLVVRAWHSISNFLFRWFVGATIVLILLITINRMLYTFRIVENYQLGEVVYAMTTFPEHPDFDKLVVTPPSDLILPDPSYPPLIRVVLFISKNPSFWLELFTKKMYYTVSHTRPYWSLKHNLFAIMFLLPTYFLTIRALISNQLSTTLKVFSATYVLLHLTISGATVVDWDGRFILPILPVLFILAGHEAIRLYQSKKRPTSLPAPLTH